MEVEFGESPASFEAGAPQSPSSLKPLAPPRGSPSWIFKEPKEFYAQRERQAERQARKSLRLVYRGALKELGHTVALPHVYVPTTMDADPPAPWERPTLSSVWGPPPFLELPKEQPSLLKKPFGAKSSTEAPTVAHYLEDERATIHGEKVRINKELWRTLTGWGRAVGGNPWTLKQVYAEIEADIDHRKAKDTRAKRGHMGPDELGKGATPQRRDLIVFERKKFKRSDAFGASSGNGLSQSSSGTGLSPGSSPSVSMMTRSCTSLPALTQGAS